MKKLAIGLVLLSGLAVVFFGLDRSAAQEKEPVKAVRDKEASLSSLPLLGALHLGMSTERVNVELLKVGVPPLKSSPDKNSIHNFKIANADISNIGLDFTKGKLTYFGGSGRFVPASQGKIDAILSSIYDVHGAPTKIYAKKYSETGVMFHWEVEAGWLYISVDPHEKYTSLSVVINDEAVPVNELDLPQSSKERQQWAESLMQRAFGKTFPVRYLPKSEAYPRDQVTTIFNPVSASGDEDYLAFFRAYADAWGEARGREHRFSHLCALKKDSSVEILLSATLGGHDGEYIPLSYDAKKRRLLLTDGTSAALLDIKTRSLIALPNITTHDASLNLKTSSLVMSAYNESNLNTYQDIYSVDLAITQGEISGGVASNKRSLASLAGEDAKPVISPDGKQVAFFHQASLAFQPGPLDPLSGSLHLRQLNGGTDKMETIKPILSGLRVVNRLSWFPDNERVLLSYEAGNSDSWKDYYAPEIVTVATKKRVILGFKPFINSDLPEGKLSAPFDMSVSSDGKQIIFRAWSWSGKTTDQAFSQIYVCDLDGSGVKKITPNIPYKTTKFRYASPGMTVENAWEISVKAYNKNQLKMEEEIMKSPP